MPNIINTIITSNIKKVLGFEQLWEKAEQIGNVSIRNNLRNRYEVRIEHKHCSQFGESHIYSYGESRDKNLAICKAIDEANRISGVYHSGD